MPKPEFTKSLLRRPLYVQLSFTLLEHLRTGRWKAGDALPNESELSREFNLSPGTVRKSLEWMEDARFIVRHQGKGTFVCDPMSDEFVRLYERVCDSNGAAVVLATEAFLTTEGEASEIECTRLKLRRGAKVRRIKRTRQSSVARCLLETIVLPAALFQLADHHINPSDTLIDLANRCGILLGKGEERISAVAATSEIAAAIGCDEGEPLMHLDRTVYTIESEPAEWRIAICRADALQYAATIGRD